MHKGFLKPGHLPTLIASVPYFDPGFIGWVMLGPHGVAVARTLHLDPAQKDLMVATQVLAGAPLRIVLFPLVDRFKARRVGVAAQIVVIAGSIAPWTIGTDSFAATSLLGCVLGLAGASLAVALAPASRETAPGIAGVGNSGPVRCRWPTTCGDLYVAARV